MKYYTKCDEKSKRNNETYVANKQAEIRENIQNKKKEKNRSHLTVSRLPVLCCGMTSHPIFGSRDSHSILSDDL